MQPSNSTEMNSSALSDREIPLPTESSLAAESSPSTANDEEAGARVRNVDDELCLDITGKSLEFDVLGKVDDSVEALYLYKNSFSLFPSSVGMLKKLRTLKFFGNKLNLFPEEFGNLVDLERLQLKVSSPGLDALVFSKLKGLKELELSKAPLRPSVITILSEIAGLKCLTKLSVCHFSIRYLPPEIGCLYNLEYLDLSFNKIKKLPTEISNLNVLLSLKVANNKLVVLPASLSSLQRLENLDLSNNRLTSVGSLQLCSMKNLQYINLQYNKLLDCSQIPPWVCCNLEGNGKNFSDDDLNSCSVEMDVYETSVQSEGEIASSSGIHNPSSSLINNGSSSNNRCFPSRRSTKRWRRRYYMQQRARQERLNNSRKWKGEGRADVLAHKGSGDCKSGEPILSSETCDENASDLIVLDDDNDKEVFSSKAENSLIGPEDERLNKDGIHMDNCSCDLESIEKDREEDCCVHEKRSVSAQKITDNEDKGSSSEKSKNVFKSKRHSDRDLDNPKPGKCQKPTGDCTSLSRKYSDLSFCSIEDRLADGFYDAGRNRPFFPLSSYEQIFPLDSREVILLDRGKDEKLDATVLSAQALVSRAKRLNVLVKEGATVSADNLYIVMLLALFVSDHFGGSDKSFTVQRTRKAVSGSNYDKPFVCTCSTGNGDLNGPENKFSGIAEDNILTDQCEKSLHSVKARRNSIVVPLGNLQFGVCRHRALLMKYLCDRMEPPIPCELVRGYLDFTPHAWNSILIKKGDLWARMLVDTCRPLDIREENDAEYFCRYIPLSRTRVPLSTESFPGPGLSTSFAPCDELEKTASSTVVRCKLGSLDAVAKVRNLQTCGTSMEEIRNFEYNCIGEVRILGALQHSCIVEMYGHQISSKWILSEDGKPQQQILQSAIIMEHVKGGSLKNYMEKMSENGEKRVPMDLALCIARDVACALAELHSRHIIHRDVKSENVLIDLDCDGCDGKPVVKLTDFDRAVPLRSFLHTCCVGHKGIPPPDVCVGTPRWMAPEVYRAMHERNRYGLEVDIWSYGCLLLELLTLQVPYSGLSESQINELLQSGNRPPLSDELKAFISENEPAATKSVSDKARPETELDSVEFLVDLFERCTEGNPTNRPKATEIYESLVSYKNRLSGSTRVETVVD